VVYEQFRGNSRRCLARLLDGRQFMRNKQLLQSGDAQTSDLSSALELEGCDRDWGGGGFGRLGRGHGNVFNPLAHRIFRWIGCFGFDLGLRGFDLLARGIVVKVRSSPAAIAEVRTVVDFIFAQTITTTLILDDKPASTFYRVTANPLASFAIFLIIDMVSVIIVLIPNDDISLTQCVLRHTLPRKHVSVRLSQGSVPHGIVKWKQRAKVKRCTSELVMSIITLLL
jgi:hypothetical protein